MFIDRGYLKNSLAIDIFFSILLKGVQASLKERAKTKTVNAESLIKFFRVFDFI